MIGIDCIAPIQTSNQFQVSAASERGSMALRAYMAGIKQVCPMQRPSIAR